MQRVRLKEKRRRPELVWALVISLLLHLLILPFVPNFITSDKDDELASEDEVVYFVQERPDDGQIVDLEDNLESETPPDSSQFLATKNRRVENQTQAKVTGPQVPTRSQQKSEQQSQQKDDDQKFETSEYGDRPKPKLNTDLPQEWLASLTPSAPSNYLPNIDYGDQTLLNTREYAYAHFFVRMKRQMELVWNPRPILQQNSRDFKPEYRTIVSIVLDKAGKVKEVKVVASSTIVDLDREAVRAVHKAGPYLNPPKELVDANGQIRINEWHFIINQQASLF